MNYVVVEGCQFGFNLGVGQVSVTSTPSDKVKCDGKKAYLEKIEFNVANYVGGAITTPIAASGSGTINGTAQKIKIEEKPAILQGDNVQITLSGMSGSTTVSQVDIVTIIAAGQTKVKGA